MSKPGNIHTIFRRSWLAINPDPFKGPLTMRLTNIPGEGVPDSDSLKDIYTILPIDKTHSGGVVDLFFNIAGLQTVDTAARSKSYMHMMLNAWKSTPNEPPRMIRIGVEAIDAIDPIQAVTARQITTVWFDMKNLPSADIIYRAGRRYKFTSMSFGYNNRSVDTLTASAPLYTNTSGDSTATVTFDLRSLPDV